MILIHVPQVTPRLKYIFNFFITDLLKLSFEFTSNEDEFNTYNGPKFTYALHHAGNGLYFQSCSLLFEQKIERQSIEIFDWENTKVFFKVNSGALPFDPFAASFYLISRYEEYLPTELDRHKRFRPENSIAWQGKFLEKPIVNIWATMVRKILSDHFPNLHIPSPSYCFTPTIDIDNAFAYLHKGVLKNSGRLLHNLLTLKFAKFTGRVKTILRFSKDPYDSYEKQFLIHEKYNLTPVYFFLLGDLSRFDRNHPYNNSGYRNLIKTISDKYPTGIHPSYQSDRSLVQLGKEKERLEAITGKAVSKSRQHYIKMKLPYTYRNLIATGITEDYSMGYASASGFRAGTSSPFLFYDLLKEEPTNLKVYPFIFMDTSLKVYQKKRSKEILPYLKPMIQDVKSYGGHLIFIFHNESIGTGKYWKNWEDMYENVIKLAIKEG